MDATDANKSSSHLSNRKRKRTPAEDPLRLAYRNINISPRESTGRPGSPHRFFKHSFTVSVEEESTQKSATASIPFSQVVHQHANGLCIVTIGDMIIKTNDEVVHIDFLCKVAPDSSASERRKRQSKMLRGKSVEGTCKPSDVLAVAKLKSGKSLSIKTCVWGHVLELNQKLTPELLQRDPLLDGYLAVVLPTGPFPPPTNNVDCNEATDEAVEDDSHGRNVQPNLSANGPTAKENKEET